MTTISKTITAEELLAMGDEARWLELYEGELRTVSPANMRHGNIAIEIAALLRQYVKPRKLGFVVVEGGYILRRNPDTVLGPDVSFISQSRVPPEGLSEKFLEGHPDLAVEIISPKNPGPELEKKMQIYLKHGTPLGWLVDPKALTVEIFRPSRPVQKLQKSESVTGESVLPGFQAQVADFFA